MYTIAQLKTDLTGRLHGTALNKITGLDDLINRAARELLLLVDPQETRRIAYLPNALFDSINASPLPSDLKGNKIIDIQPFSSDVSRSNVSLR